MKALTNRVKSADVNDYTKRTSCFLKLKVNFYILKELYRRNDMCLYRDELGVYFSFLGVRKEVSTVLKVQ